MWSSDSSERMADRYSSVTSPLQCGSHEQCLCSREAGAGICRDRGSLPASVLIMGNGSQICRTHRTPCTAVFNSISKYEKKRETHAKKKGGYLKSGEIKGDFACRCLQQPQNTGCWLYSGVQESPLPYSTVHSGFLFRLVYAASFAPVCHDCDAKRGHF